MRPRARLYFFVFLAPVLLVGAAEGTSAASAAAQEATVTPVRVIELQGPIDRPLLAYLEERLDEAEKAGAIVVLQLDTPGMMGQDALALADRVVALDYGQKIAEGTYAEVASNQRVIEAYLGKSAEVGG